ncbi:hypothetical protein [Tepidimicrobium xylanilyticum]
MNDKIWVILLLVLLIPLKVYSDYMEPTEIHMERAIVLEVEEGENIEEIEGLLGQVQYVKLQILSGKFKGQIFEVENNLSNNMAYDIVVKKGIG